MSALQRITIVNQTLGAINAMLLIGFTIYSGIDSDDRGGGAGAIMAAIGIICLISAVVIASVQCRSWYYANALQRRTVFTILCLLTLGVFGLSINALRELNVVSILVFGYILLNFVSICIKGYYSPIGKPPADRLDLRREIARLLKTKYGIGITIITLIGLYFMSKESVFIFFSSILLWPFLLAMVLYVFGIIRTWLGQVCLVLYLDGIQWYIGTRVWDYKNESLFEIWIKIIALSFIPVLALLAWQYWQRRKVIQRLRAYVPEPTADVLSQTE